MLSMRTNLLGRSFKLRKVATFGGNFVFWNVDQTDCDSTVLQASHITALILAQYLDRSTVAKAVAEEGLSLTRDELENVRLFGHPLVRALYMPHITLGFNPGISELARSTIDCSWPMEVASVELVRVGHPGRVESVIDLARAA